MEAKLLKLVRILLLKDGTMEAVVVLLHFKHTL